MKKEIGGYMELENFSGEEYYPNLYKVNLGRTALIWLIQSRKCSKIFLPHFLCDSVIDACRGTGTELSFYSLDENLNPLLPQTGKLAEGEYLYLVNYYGQLTDSRILEYQKQYGQIIVDHTHAFFQRPLSGVDTLYSCRKFFGLSDGAYLSTETALIPLDTIDCSAARMGHILGRYEHDAGSFYQQMLDNASTYHQEQPKYMSRLTRNLLKAIDYEKAKQQRETNYRCLASLLPSENIFTQYCPEGPFAYPYYHPNGMKLRRELAKEKIFVPTNWSNVRKDMPENSLEYDWASNILPLPCDQRYGTEDMTYMARILRDMEASL